MKYPEIPRLPSNPERVGMYKLMQNIKYSNVDDAAHMTLIVPTALRNERAADGSMGLAASQDIKPMPLVVFIQGSAWTTPFIDGQIPQLCELAKHGYVVATVCHRSIVNGHRFPAFLEDCKCAIRYLRANASRYAIDPERVAVWGTSSGGNTAMLIGLTGDDETLKTGEHSEYSDSVNCVVSCFGIADVARVLRESEGSREAETTMKMAFAGDSSTWEEQMKSVSPIHRAEESEKFPSFLLMHGTGDKLVRYEQMVDMYHKLIDRGADVVAYQVDDADHEGDFWSKEVYEKIFNYLDEHLN